MLTKVQWEQWFHQHLRPLLMVVGFNACTLFNQDESSIFMDSTAAGRGRKVYALLGSKSVFCRAGHNRTHVSCLAAVVGDGSQLPVTSLFKEKPVARSWYSRAAIPLSLCGKDTG